MASAHPPVGPSPRRRRAELPLLVAAGAASLLLGEALGLTVCPTAGLFGIPCPSCGLTRATLALLRGRIAESLALHPLVVVVLPALAVGVLFGLLREMGMDPSGAITKRLAYAANAAALLLASLAIALWAARFFGAFGGPVAVDPWFW